MLEKIKERLESLGYDVKDEDELLLIFSLKKTENTIKNECNVSEIPDDLTHIAIDMAVGEFLSAKKTFSPAELSGIDLDFAVKQIQVGDTSTTFSVENCQSPEQRLDSFINHLLTYGKSQFPCFRRLKW